LLTILLMPVSAKEKIIISGDVYQREITWNQELLKRMLQHRYEKFAGKRAVLEQHFEEDMLNHLIARISPTTPGRFIQLWHVIAEQMQTGELISREHIEDALQK